MRRVPNAFKDGALFFASLLMMLLVIASIVPVIGAVVAGFLLLIGVATVPAGMSPWLVVLAGTCAFGVGCLATSAIFWLREQ